MSSNDILNFLPKYPDINEYQESYMNPYNKSFNEAIFRKNEFYENKLSKIELQAVVEDVNTDEEILTTNDCVYKKPLKSQVTISRFFSSRTLNDRLLLFHLMGVGKTCTAVGAIEQIKSEGSTFKGALILAKGDTLLNNFKEELSCVCTDGQYLPSNYKYLTDLERTHRVNKLISQYYTFETFEKFAKDISKKSDEDVVKSYSNLIIVVDEVHNLRLYDELSEDELSEEIVTIEKKKTDSRPVIYDQFYRLCHLGKNNKILFLSGTPMKDSPSELASIMNLLLPKSQNLPTGDKFKKRYFDEVDVVDGNEILVLKENKIKELKAVLNGHVSYLRPMPSTVDKKFIGEVIEPLSYLIVDVDTMSNFQSKYYKSAWDYDTEKREIYANSRQASLFVFPDGSYGSEGFSKYLQQASSKTVNEGKISSFKLSDTLKRDLTKNVTSTMNETQKNDTILKNLKQYSSKYEKTIREILKARNEKKSVFVYNEFVVGSASILFGKILELFGFSPTQGNESSKKSRYAIINNLTATQRDIKNIVKTFNKPTNLYGEIINVIIGSRVISEGISLKNVQQVHILTPHWNYSETDQAIARGSRLGSHNDLIKAGIIPVLDIFQHVSMSDNETPSIDLKMYVRSECKDRNIKQIERIIKEAAFDCALNYSRNHVTTASDNQRDCDYMSCDYTCDNISEKPPEYIVKPKNIDYLTYNIYYSQELIQQNIEYISNFFHTNFSFTIEQIRKTLNRDNKAEGKPNLSLFQILSTLRYMITNNTIIFDKYGFDSYLREQQNVYYLVNSLSAEDNYLSDYYVKNPLVYTQNNFNNIINNLYTTNLPKFIETIFNTDDYKTLERLLNELPLDIQEYLLEKSLLAQRDSKDKNINNRNMILKYYKPFYFEDNKGTLVSSLLYEETDLLRYLKRSSNTWKDDTKNKYASLVKKVKLTEKKKLEDNPYGYFGTYNERSFCIKKVGEPPAVTEAKKIIDEGTPIPNLKDMKVTQKTYYKSIDKLSLELLKEKLSSIDYLSDYLTDELTKEEITRILFWGKVDGRTFEKGTQCDSYSKEDALKFVLEIFKIKPLAVKNEDKESLLSFLKKVIGNSNIETIRTQIPVNDGFVNTDTMINAINNLVSKNNLFIRLQKLISSASNISQYYTPELTPEQLISLAFWKLGKKEICFYIRQFLEDNDLLKYDKNCGTAEKTKKSK